MPAYSPRSLIQKLGIKANYKIALFNPPESYFNEIDGIDLPLGVEFAQSLDERLDFIHMFTGKKAELEEHFKLLADSIKPDGSLWISWPKGSSGVKTDLDENIVREIGLKAGLVDVKVIAVDEIWSGLKFVYRLKDRNKS